ncbi:hypothetical protein [Aeromicrobium sp.]|uniref:hypothetical protein n=1 Tax=Aeromicrobium sp. TaxID=1871063 RepID=UPI003D6A62D6
MNLRMVIPIQIAVIALVAGLYFVYAAVRGPSSSDEPAPSSTLGAAMATIEPRVYSDKGGFMIGVPDGLTAKKDGKTVSLRSSDGTLVAVAGPIERGTLTANSKTFIRSMKVAYTKVRVLRSEEQQVDGRKALATYGQAVNAKKVRIRFVNVVVKAPQRNFAINSFAAFDTNPAIVLPKVNAIVSGFSVRL